MGVVGVRGSAAFAGREPEMAELAAAWQAAVAGRGGLLLLSGEPGAGKTRLAEELATRVAGEGASVAWGAGWEGGGAPALWPWREILRALHRVHGPDFVRERAGVGLPWVLELLPELAAGGVDDGPRVRSAQQARFEMFDAVTTVVLAAADQAPLLVVLDDLHAADTASGELLRFAGERARSSAVLFVGTFRDAPARADEDFAAVVAGLERTGQRLPVVGLDRPGVAAVLIAHGVDATAELTGRVVEATAGNAFFVAEVARWLAARPAGAPAEQVPIPDGVRRTVRLRLNDMSADARVALDAAAVLGVEFDAQVLAGVSGFGGQELQQRLDDAARADLVRNPAPGRWRFVHALVRDTLVDDLPVARRTALHAAAARALAGLHPDDVQVEETARHLLAAIPHVDAHDAAAAARRAGAAALRVAAFERAVEWFERAGQALVHAGAGDTSEAAEVAFDLADARRQAGRLEESLADFDRAIELARRHRDARLQTRAAIGYHDALWRKAIAFYAPVVDRLTTALTALGDSDRRLRVEALQRLVEAYYVRFSGATREDVTDEQAAGERRLAEAAAAEAQTLAQGVDDPAVQMRALDAYLTARPELFARFDPRAVDLYEQALRLADQAGDLEYAAYTAGLYAAALLDHGDLDRFAVAVERLGVLARRLGQHGMLAAHAGHGIWLATLRGDFAGAEALVPAVLQAPEMPQSFGFHVFLARWEQGRLAELAGDVDLAYPDAAWPWSAGARALVRAAEGRRYGLDKAVAPLLAGRDVPLILFWAGELALMAAACELLGDTRAAAAIERPLRPYDDKHAVAGRGYLGPIAYWLGVLARVQGRAEDAARWFEQAIATCEANGAVTWLGHARGDLADVLVDLGGDDQRTQQLLDDADATAQRFGMVRLADKITGTRARLQPATVPATTSSGQRVFRLEGEFWTVAFDGEVCRLRDSKGLRALALLLAHPGREVHALDVAAAAEQREGVRAGDLAAAGAAPLLDDQARAAYQRRLADLRAERDDADHANDPASAARADAEIDALTAELRRAYGLGGRPRGDYTPAERARLSVTKTVKAALDKLAEHAPALAAHLRATVRTGTYCSYTPDPTATSAWQP